MTDETVACMGWSLSAQEQIDGFRREVRELKAENAKLRNEVDNLLDFEHLTSVAVAYAGCDECGEYKQTMLRLFAENAKLRELASLVSEYISYDRCEGCVTKTTCNSHELDECWMTTKLRNQLRELGVD